MAYGDRIPLGRAKDITGERFGRLVALYRVEGRQNSASWKCQCDCGNMYITTLANLRSGTQSCGCLQKEVARKNHSHDLTGQRFGKLTVLENTGNKTDKGYIIWRCQCDCGNICNKNTNDLIQGTKSCGCIHKDIMKEVNKKKIKNLIGKRFGALTVIEDSGKRSSGHNIIWKCKCDCGKEIFVAGNNLQRQKSCGCKRKCINLTGNRYGKLIVLEYVQNNLWKCKCDCGNYCIRDQTRLIRGETISCGCIKSNGEVVISKILRNNDIMFIQQKSFYSCRFPDTNALAFFDFYVNDKYLIEFDGKQHFYISGGWNNENNFQKVQEHDNYKNQWCKENNIPLIRIPYTHLKDLCIEDLLLETSKFIINKGDN